jgi:tetratricopeptide (TPR) repeat protein
MTPTKDRIMLTNRPLLSAALSVLVLAGCARDPEVAKREYLRSGDAYVAQQKLREAVVEYSNAVQQDPRFGEARLKLAQTYLELGDLGSAFREYVRAADALPADADTQVKVGEMLLVARQFQEATSRADKALAAKPNHVPALILRANALAGLNRIEDALSEVELAIRTEPDRSESYASLGLMQFMRGDRAQAEAAFKKAVDTNQQSTQARLALANFYTVSGQMERAEEQFKAALAINSKDLLANRALAYFYIASRRAPQAEPHLKVVADASPNDTGKVILADYYIGMSRFDDARRLLETIAANGTSAFATAKLRLAALSLFSGDPAAAMRFVEDVLAKQPSHTDALVAKAELLARSGRWVDGLAAARAAVASNQHSAKAQFVLGQALALRRDDVNAIAAFNQALQLNPRLAAAELELAKVHLTQGRLKEAERFAQAAITKLEGYAEAHLLLARIHLMNGQPAKAELSLKALTQAFPDSPAVQTEVGLLEMSKRNRQAARAAFTRVLDRHPTHIEALAGLNQLDVEEKRADLVKARMTAALRTKPQDGRMLVLASRTYASLGDLATAEAMLQKAIAADPNTLDAYGMLGRLYATQQRLDEATAQFEKLAEKQPASVSAHTIVGMLLDMQNRTSEARQKYERALAIDPRAAVAANNLAWIYAETGGNLDIALQLAQTAKSQLPERPEVNDTLGWVYHKKGLSALAVTPLLQSVQRDPTNATYHYHLGMAYAGSGDNDKARASLRRALSLDGNFSGAVEARQALQGLKG